MYVGGESADLEIDTQTFEIARRFSVAVDHEGPLDQFDVEPYTPNTPTCSPTWAVATPTEDRIFVACNRADHILEIDYEDWTLLRRIPTGRGPYNLAITPDGKTLVSTLKQGGACSSLMWHRERATRLSNPAPP